MARDMQNRNEGYEKMYQYSHERLTVPLRPVYVLMHCLYILLQLVLTSFKRDNGIIVVCQTMLTGAGLR